MHSINSLVHKLQADYPQFHFQPGESFTWSPHENTITYISNSTDSSSLLHELSHAILGHTNYLKDIELIQMESDAWHTAQSTISKNYDIKINDANIQRSLDTYREWLHSRSICPSCQATGVQTAKNLYKCIACTQPWRVNEARICALRRYTFNL